MKLKLSKRPVKNARMFGEELVRYNFPRDMFGMTILTSVGMWANARNIHLQQLQCGKEMKQKMRAALGLAIACILRVAHDSNVIVTFNTMDSYIEIERKHKTKKVDYALGVFSSAFSKWCVSVTCYQEPDEGVTQQMLQLMLNAVGLMCFLSKKDPVVDCFLPIYFETKKQFRAPKK